MLIKAAINGGRARSDHSAVPISPAEQASAVAECLLAGANAIHLHVRSTATESNPSEKESLSEQDVTQTLAAVQAVCSRSQIGVSTGAWIVPHPERLGVVGEWKLLPGFASVNFTEDGASELAELLLSRSVGVEAGLCDAESAEVFVKSGLAERCLRVLLEPQEQEIDDARNTVSAIEKVLDSVPVKIQRLLHGTEATAWPMFDAAIARGYGVRIGLEDTLVTSSGGMAQNNAELVTEAFRRVQNAGRRL